MTFDDQTMIINISISSNISMLGNFTHFCNYLKCVVHQFHRHCAPVYIEFSSIAFSVILLMYQELNSWPHTC